uniref:Uncharacterized protein n=1 Tax=Oryza punctata TaxID=4537 RepID=A0A0E0LCP3_ORYPU
MPAQRPPPCPWLLRRHCCHPDHIPGPRHRSLEFNKAARVGGVHWSTIREADIKEGVFPTITL